MANSSMTYIMRNGDHRKVNTTMISGYHLLKFIAFSTNLVELLGEGLKTYANERYFTVFSHKIDFFFIFFYWLVIIDIDNSQNC